MSKNTQLIHRIDPVSLYIEHLIRRSLPRSVALKTNDIVLTKVVQAPELFRIPNTIVLEHRKSERPTALINKINKGGLIEEGFFKSTQSQNDNLTIRRIAGDPNNSAGWYFGQPLLITLVTLLPFEDPMEETVAMGMPVPMQYVMTNHVLNYPEENEGVETISDLISATAAHTQAIAEAQGKQEIRMTA